MADIILPTFITGFIIAIVFGIGWKVCAIKLEDQLEEAREIAEDMHLKLRLQYGDTDWPTLPWRENNVTT